MNIYSPHYFPGATFKSLPGLFGLLGELLGITTYSPISFPQSSFPLTSGSGNPTRWSRGTKTLGTRLLTHVSGEIHQIGQNGFWIWMSIKMLLIHSFPETMSCFCNSISIPSSVNQSSSFQSVCWLVSTSIGLSIHPFNSQSASSVVTQENPWLEQVVFMLGLRRISDPLSKRQTPTQSKRENKRCLEKIIRALSCWGAGMAQWWKHSPPTIVARVRLLDSASYVGWVCWFSTLHREVFSGYSGFPSPQKPAFDLIFVDC